MPIFLAWESDYIYVLSTFGQKIEWMRTNPKVCVEIEEIATPVSMGERDCEWQLP